MDSKALNAKIEKIIDRFEHLRDGRIIPYIGWYWREVDFNETISLGDCGSCVGFMENNKWGYPDWVIAVEQSDAIKSLLESIDLSLSDDVLEIQLEAIYTYIQTCAPSDRSVKDIRDEAIKVIKENEAMGPSIESMMGIPLYKEIK